MLDELVAGYRPYESLEEDMIESLYEQGRFPDVEGLLLADLILGGWKGRFVSAHEVLRFCEHTNKLEGSCMGEVFLSSRVSSARSVTKNFYNGIERI